jgi:Kef-type K+ transport system membrane component KefB
VSTIASLLGVAALAMALGVRTKLPTASLLIIAGWLIRATGAPLDEEIVRQTLLLSATFLVFLVGIEVEPRHVRGPLRRASALALVQIAALAIVAWGVGQRIGLDPVHALYLALAFSSSSTLLVIEILRRRKRFYEPFARLVLGAVLLQDVLVVLALVGLGFLGVSRSEVLVMCGGTAALVVAAWALGRFVAPALFMRANLDEEEQILAVVAVLFAFVGIAHLCNLPLVVGAFFCGHALARFPIGGLVRGHVLTFSDFFVTAFFVALGASLVVPSPRALLAEGIFLLVLVLVVPIILIPIFRRAGSSLRASLEGVGLMAQCGELGIVVALVGLGRGHLSEPEVGMIIVVATVTMILVGVFSSDRFIWGVVHLLPSRVPRSVAVGLGDHVIVIGAGESGRVIVDALEGEVAVAVIDDDPSVVAELEARGIVAVRGDGSDASVLRQLAPERARVVVSTMRRLADNLRIVKACGRTPVLVRVFAPEDAEAVRELGGHAVVESELTTHAFLQWFAERFDADAVSSAGEGSSPPAGT